MSLLELQGITASYGASQALFGVDLSLEEGEVIALMGRNGMGKSTTIKVICRLLKHTQGWHNLAATTLANCPRTKPRGWAWASCPKGGGVLNRSPCGKICTRLRGRANGILQRCISFSHGLKSAARNWPDRFQGANSKCWPLAGL